MFRGTKLRHLNRVLCGLVGLGAVVVGLIHPGHEISYSYRNWFGGLAFGPVIAVLGVVALLGAVFNWRNVWDSPASKPTQSKQRGR